MSFDPQAVRDFEHRGWERAAARYGATFARATEGFVAPLLDAAAVAAGMRVLDLACGPGLVAAAVAERGAEPIGTDFSAAMLAEARARNPTIRFERADAESLPFAEGDFDTVLSNFGVHHFPEPARALSEVRRVLRPGGRVAFTSWAAPSENPAWKLLFEAVAGHGDPEAAKAPPSGGGLRRPEDARALLDKAGFVGIETCTLARRWPLATADDPGSSPGQVLLAGFRQGTVRTAAVIEAQTAEARAAITAALAEGAASYRDAGGGYSIPVIAILACGVKPDGR
ncbi:MAG: class I SAM-dependent methyltransferase [Stellaceae bacterium]